jgi:hypothetical protein
MAAIGGGGGAAILLVVLAVLFLLRGGGKTEENKASAYSGNPYDINSVGQAMAFENPMYANDETGGDSDDSTADGGGLYDEPDMIQGNDGTSEYDEDETVDAAEDDLNNESTENTNGAATSTLHDEDHENEYEEPTGYLEVVGDDEEGDESSDSESDNAEEPADAETDDE